MKIKYLSNLHKMKVKYLVKGFIDNNAQMMI